MADYAEPAAWHASLPGVVMGAAALIGDGAGRVLVVKPNYRDHWSLPGGICEAGEAPHEGCEREVAEELGLRLTAGPLLAVHWQRALPVYGDGARPGVFFVFDGGTLPAGAQVTLQEEELDDWRFAADAELAGLLPPELAARVRAAAAARVSGAAAYVAARPA